MGGFRGVSVDERIKRKKKHQWSSLNRSPLRLDSRSNRWVSLQCRPRVVPRVIGANSAVELLRNTLVAVGRVRGVGSVTGVEACTAH